VALPYYYSADGFSHPSGPHGSTKSDWLSVGPMLKLIVIGGSGFPLRITISKFLRFYIIKPASEAFSLFFQKANFRVRAQAMT